MAGATTGVNGELTGIGARVGGGKVGTMANGRDSSSSEYYKSDCGQLNTTHCEVRPFT